MSASSSNFRQPPLDAEETVTAAFERIKQALALAETAYVALDQAEDRHHPKISTSDALVTLRVGLDELVVVCEALDYLSMGGSGTLTIATARRLLDTAEKAGGAHRSSAGGKSADAHCPPATLTARQWLDVAAQHLAQSRVALNTAFEEADIDSEEEHEARDALESVEIAYGIVESKEARS